MLLTMNQPEQYPPTSQYQPQPQMVYAQPYPQPPQKSNAGLIATIIGSVVVLIAFGVVALGFSQGWFDSSSESSTDPVVVTEYQTQAPAAPAASSGTKTFTNYSASTSMTSSDFARAVFNAYVAEVNRSGNTSPRLSSVYSPVTGKFYTMNCSYSGGTATCSGGNNAVVTIW